MKRGRILIACVILFIGINILFVYFDDNGTIERKSYVTEWSEVFVADFYKKMEKPGVLTPIKENDVYFDKSVGSFQGFLVEEGAQVNQGDQLYTYRVHDYYETKTYLTNERDKISGEIAAIETAISEISSYRIPSSSGSGTNSTMDNTNNEIEIKIETPDQPIEAEYMKEQYLTEKQKELANEEAHLASVQTQLTELESGGDTITVKSPYQGNVTLVSESLGDPLMTIDSPGLHIVGELTEDERTVINKDMPVEIAVNENKTTWKGTITSISDSPEVIALHDNSAYPFSVAFAADAEIEDLLPGYHANLSITTDASKDAQALFDDAIVGNSVWKMTNEGKIRRQKVETGLKMGRMQEITEGAKTGEWIAKDPESNFRSGEIFLTPLKLEEMQWSDFKDKSWNKYAIIGLLSR